MYLQYSATLPSINNQPPNAPQYVPRYAVTKNSFSFIPSAAFVFHVVAVVAVEVVEVVGEAAKTRRKEEEGVDVYNVERVGRRRRVVNVCRR